MIGKNNNTYSVQAESSKFALVLFDQKFQILVGWNWSERHLLVFCINTIVPGVVVYYANRKNSYFFTLDDKWWHQEIRVILFFSLLVCLLQMNLLAVQYFFCCVNLIWMFFMKSNSERYLLNYLCRCFSNLAKYRFLCWLKRNSFGSHLHILVFYVIQL